MRSPQPRTSHHPAPAATRPAAGRRSAHSARTVPTAAGTGAAGWFMAPFFLLFALVTLAPIGYAAWLSLFRAEQSGLGFGGARQVFSGIGNYTKALSDPLFLASFRHVAVYCLLYIPVMVGGALVLALLLDSALARARRFFQIAFYLPHAVPGLIAALIWLYLYTPGLSPVLDVLDSAGISWNFFGRDEALLSVVNVSAWQWMGYNMIIFYAGLQAVPRETLEAATMDGAGAVRTAFQVKVPSIRPTIILTVLFTCVGAVQLFDAPQLLQLRATEMGESWSPTMYIFSAAFKGHDYGLAAASALLLALAAGAASYVVTKLGNRWRSA
nr:sugar ABC transporter permease [Streptomyces sp. A1547]